MQLTWLGTAGFEIKTNGSVFLLDPFLSRHPHATPFQPLSTDDLNQADQIFISHGHFDHVSDVPAIAGRTGAMVFASTPAADRLEKRLAGSTSLVRVDRDRVEYALPDYTAQAFFSRHIRFDAKLFFSTLMKIHVKLPLYLPLLTRYPCGQTLSWLFTVDSRSVLFFGSAGSPPAELAQYRGLAVDTLLLPVQGHSRIIDISLNYIRAIRPGRVIVHHFDSFWPPISKTIDLTPLTEQVEKQFPDIEVIIPEINQPLPL